MKRLTSSKTAFFFSLAGAVLLGEMGAEAANDKFANAKSSNDVQVIEALLRQKHELDANDAQKKAGEAFKSGDFETAVDAYKTAIKWLEKAAPSDPQVKQRILNLNRRIVTVYEAWTDKLIMTAKGDAYVTNYALALEKLYKAIEFKDSLDELVVKRLQSQIDAVEAQKSKKDYLVAVDAAEIRSESAEVKRATDILFDQAQILYKHNKYMEAKTTLESTLVEDPYHTGAVRLLKRVYEKLNEVAEERRDEIVSHRVMETNWKWSESFASQETTSSSVSNEATIPLQADETTTLKGKLKDIKLPVVKFKNARVEDIIEDLKKRSRELDPDGKGINILFLKADEKVSNDDETAEEEDAFADDPETTEEDPWGDDPESTEEVEEENSLEERLITVEFEDIATGDFIKFICDAAGLRYKVEKHAVVIAGPNVVLDEMDTRFIPVPAGFIEIAETSKTESIGGDDEDVDESDSGEEFKIKDYFTSLGVSFPTGSQIRYIPKLNRIVLTNNITNLEIAEKVIEELSIKPNQVMIEAKFVDVNQTDFEAVGFEWFLTNTSQDFNVGSIVGEFGNQVPGTDASATVDGLTNGLRNFGFSLSDSGNNASDLSATFSLQARFGNLELQGLLTAIDQKTNSDILSAPKITARNGELAELRVVEERFFPINWEKPEIEFQNLPNAGRVPVVTPSIPEFDEARDIGVIFTVTPNIDPDGLSMELELNPKIIEFLGFDDRFGYQLPIGETETDFTDVLNPVSLVQEAIGTFTDNTTIVNVPIQMPIISARTVESTVRVWDGETVMIGGLLREEVIRVEDSIPYLSDIPFLGRIFESKGSRREKNHLMIFVTSRLVNSAGLPLRSNFDKGLPDYNRI